MKRSVLHVRPKRAPVDRKQVNEIVVASIFTKPRMSLDEGGRNQAVGLSAKERREVTSLLRKAHSLLADWWRDENADHVSEAGVLLKRAIKALTPPEKPVRQRS